LHHSDRVLPAAPDFLKLHHVKEFSTFDAALPPALRDAYRAALYEVDTDADTITLRVDQHSAALLTCMRAAGCTRAAYITAFNPASRQQTAAENQLAHIALLRRLQRQSLRYQSGRCRDPAGLWPDEVSVLVLGICFEDAQELAREFGQIAWLWCDSSATPRLVASNTSQRP
jgi:hypothetical protein